MTDSSFIQYLHDLDQSGLLGLFYEGWQDITNQTSNMRPMDNEDFKDWMRSNLEYEEMINAII